MGTFAFNKVLSAAGSKPMQGLGPGKVSKGLGWPLSTAHLILPF